MLATDLPEIAEPDVNPLFADGGGVIAAGARVLLAPRDPILPHPLPNPD
jgi:hypothetical protein